MVSVGNLRLCLSVLTLFVRLILGIAIALFSKCMVALFDPIHRRGEPIKWGLVTYTVVMFSLVTIGTALQFDTQSVSYIDNRQFPGAGGIYPPGQTTYQDLIAFKPIAVIQNVTFILSNWLADGCLVSSLFDAVFTCPGP